MDNISISIIGISYLLIGIFLGGVIEGENPSDFFGITVLFWPIMIAAFVFILIISIPFKIGVWVRDKFNLHYYF